MVAHNQIRWAVGSEVLHLGILEDSDQYGIGMSGEVVIEKFGIPKPKVSIEKYKDDDEEPEEDEEGNEKEDDTEDEDTEESDGEDENLEENKETIKALIVKLDKDNKGTKHDKLLKAAIKKGMDEDELNEATESLMDLGIIYEPVLGRWKCVDDGEPEEEDEESENDEDIDLSGL